LSKFSHLKSRIKKNEGYNNQIYYDQVGKPTIGFGHLIKKREKFLHQKKYSKKYLNKLFEDDFSSVLSKFNKSYKVKGLSKNSQEVILEMIFQLGIKNCLKFKKFNKSLKKKLPYMAALEMLNSHWYVQTPKRVEKLIDLLLEYKNVKQRR
jgi:lysozyme